ncbi:unnamed protein product [Lactuca virosa]|uniref:Uncharacterized protein n=1 Tax=Lactuca virosa TaxID=75947 RepID=A0AAU9NTK7_9ASTR|nr:unnamed protein product [Lactuca virosa]
MVPKKVIVKLKKLKSKSKSSGVVIIEPTDEEAQQNNKRKDDGLFKPFKKFRAQTVEELSTTNKDVTVESNTDETSNPYVTVQVSNVDTNIDSCEPISTSLHGMTNVTPPEGSISKSNMEKGRSSNMIENLSNKDSNVTIGEETSTSTSYTSNIPPPHPHLHYQLQLSYQQQF